MLATIGVALYNRPIKNKSNELDKLTGLAWRADVKTTSMTHAELLMQRHNAALISVAIVIDYPQAVLLLATNRMQRHQLARHCACAVSPACGAFCLKRV